MTPAAFFRTHAGFSYDPAKETKAQGRARYARALAKAEVAALFAGLHFAWEVDDIDSRDFSDDPEPWALYACTAYNATGDAVAHLGGIDFGRDGTPHADPYRRVVEAELALEAIA